MARLNKNHIIQQLGTKQAKTRFAPSPTGYLHLGHILSALYVWSIAKHFNGRVVLRIENHDKNRSKQHYSDSILKDLDVLGLLEAEQTEHIIYQSECEDHYQNYYQKLQKQAHIFACSCTRRDLLPTKGLESERYYPNHCNEKNLAFDASRSHRLLLLNKTQQFNDLAKGTISQNPHDLFGALVVKDKEQNWSYAFSSSVDDILQDINFIIRGEDLLHVTSRQLDLREQLQHQDFKTVFLHHPLIFAKNHKKLSKRNADSRAVSNDTTAPELIGQAAALIGINPKNYRLSLAGFTELLFDE